MILVWLGGLLLTVEDGRSCGDQANCTACIGESGCAWTSCKGAVASCTEGKSPSCDKVPCTAPTPPGKCQHETSRNDTNLVGSDLANRQTGTDPAACCHACSTYPGCKGWTLIVQLSRCYLKSADGPFAPKNGFISGVVSGPPAPPPFKMGCSHPPQSAMDFCNASLAVEVRIQDVIGRLSTSEKAEFLLSRNPSVQRLGIGSYDWDTEVLHGVFSRGNFPAGLQPRTTIFPNGIGLAASFDVGMIERVGAAIGTEQRALNNYVLASASLPSGVESGQYQGINGYAPNCNLYRDPRWGRAQETYGESPTHNGAMCVGFIRGLQGNHSSFIRIAATVKHYAFYSGPECDHGCPEFPGENRGDFNVVVDPQDAAQSYLPMFKAAVGPVERGGGGSSSIMSSFSHVNGVDMAANKHLLQDVLRDEFGFDDGIVVTDWGSIRTFEGADPLVPNQPGCKNYTCVMKRARECLDAGTDMDLRGGYQVLGDAIVAGIVSLELVEKSLRRIFKVAFKLGRFDPPASVPFRSIPVTAIGAAKHRALAKEAAIKAMVLVQNGISEGNAKPPDTMTMGDRPSPQGVEGPERRPLPINHAKLRGISIIGPSANVSGADAISAYCGDYATCENCAANHSVNVVTGITNYLTRIHSNAKVLFAQGCCADGRNGTDSSGIAAAVADARNPQVSHVVLAVGLDGGLEGEGNDRLPSRFPNGIGLPGVQQQLVDAVLAVGKPTTVVVIGGGAMPVAVSGPNVSVIFALYPGVEIGNALAEMLFGAVSPSAKLPYTVPASVKQLPLYTNFSMVAKPFGRTFSWIQGPQSQPLHEYGFGLSYSAFKYTELQVTSPTATNRSVQSSLIVEVTVTNVGSVISDEVLQIYTSWDPEQGWSQSIRVPVRQLVAFGRLEAVAPGASRKWKGVINADRYALVDNIGKSVIPAGKLTLSVGGHQPTKYSSAASGSECVSKVMTL